MAARPRGAGLGRRHHLTAPSRRRLPRPRVLAPERWLYPSERLWICKWQSLRASCRGSFLPQPFHHAPCPSWGVSAARIRGLKEKISDLKHIFHLPAPLSSTVNTHVLWIHLGFWHLVLVPCIFMNSGGCNAALVQVSRDILQAAGEILGGLYKKRALSCGGASH